MGGIWNSSVKKEKMDHKVEGHQGITVTQVLHQLVGGRDVYVGIINEPVCCLAVCV